MRNILSRLTVNPHMHISLAHQIKHQISWMIINGELKSGDSLPSLRELARHLSVNLHTVRSAYKLLENECFVDSHQGRETKVIDLDLRRIVQAQETVRTNTVGVVVASLENPFFHSMLAGIAEAAEQTNSLLFVCNSQNDSTEAWRYFLRLSAKQVDGIIVISQSVEEIFDHASIQNGTAIGIPFVSVDWPGVKGPSILLDLEGAGYLATRHLIEHGHRRIGLITYFLDVENVLPVNQGYFRALEEAGIKSDYSYVARVPAFEYSAGEDGGRYLANLPEPPTAVFAITDLMAAGAMHSFKSLGYRVPEDIALVGVDDIPLAQWLDPPLTTISTPSYEIGKSAMNRLQNIIAGKPLPEQQTIFPVSLVVRQSCGRHSR